MAEQGWLLTKDSFFYHFKRSTPRKAVIRIDFRNFKSNQEYLEYCTLFETPFALLRAFGTPIFPLIAAVLYAGFAIKMRRLYRAAMCEEKK